jgi:hypothetical protein
MIATLKKARGVLMPDKREKLAAAIARSVDEVHRLDQQFAAIKTELSKRMDWTYFEEKRKAAASEYERSKLPEALETLLLSELLLEKAQERLAGSRRALLYGTAAQDEFVRQFPLWRDALAKPCRLKLQLAKDAFERVTAEEKKRLGDEYDEEEIEQSPVVRRAADVVRRWEFRLKKIQSDASELAWGQNFAAVLER